MGCLWDNAVAVVANFFSTLKLELSLDDNRGALVSPRQLQSDLAFWKEGYCSCERRHSAIGYLSPIDYEKQFIAARTLAPVNPSAECTKSGESQLYPMMERTGVQDRLSIS